jgi:glutathione S-transferase
VGGSRVVPAFHRFLQWQPPASSADGDDKGGEDERCLAVVRERSCSRLSKSLLRRCLLLLCNTDTKTNTSSNTTGPFFLGAKPSLVGFVIAPWIVRLWVFDTFKEGGVGIPAVGEAQGGADEVLWARFEDLEGCGGE